MFKNTPEISYRVEDDGQRISRSELICDIKNLIRRRSCCCSVRFFLIFKKCGFDSKIVSRLNIRNQMIAEAIFREKLFCQ
jgi:hypothetical protein